MSLLHLPYELVAYVVQDLDLVDICNLSYTCKKFQFLVRDVQITKRLLEVSSPMPMAEMSAC
jgi:hypothetical protein